MDYSTNLLNNNRNNINRGPSVTQSLQRIEECSFKNPDGKVFKYEENLKAENGRISCLCKLYEFNSTTCGILVKNIVDKDYGNWR